VIRSQNTSFRCLLPTTGSCKNCRKLRQHWISSSLTKFLPRFGLWDAVCAIIAPWASFGEVFRGLQRLLETGGWLARTGAASKLRPRIQAPLGLGDCYIFGPQLFFGIIDPMESPVEDALRYWAHVKVDIPRSWKLSKTLIYLYFALFYWSLKTGKK
jgi:hypothetical protein